MFLFRRTLAVASLLLSSLAGLLACGEPAPPTEPPGRVLLVGIEGLSAELVQSMVDDGELPHFARLLEEGAFARLTAPRPLEPMQLWTTALTGKRPSTHRVVGEMVRLPGSGRTTRTPSSQRQTRNLFQIAGEAGRTVAAVGFPGTWPAEVVNGHVAANGWTPHRWTETVEHDFDMDQAPLAFYPPQLEAELEPYQRSVEELERETVSRFFTFNETEFEMLYDRPLGSIFRHENPPRDFALTLQSDRSNLDAVEHLIERYHPRLAAVHLQLPAAVQPTWWYFFRGDRYDLPRDSRRRLGEAVPETYRWIDEQVGRLWEGLGENDALVVVSPLGFGDVPTPPDENGESQLAPGPTDDGALWIVAPMVKAGARARSAEVDDLTPTLLAIMDVDVGGDMDGRVLRELLRPEFLDARPVTMTESHDLEWDESRRYPERPQVSSEAPPTPPEENE